MPDASTSATIPVANVPTPIIARSVTACRGARVSPCAASARERGRRGARPRRARVRRTTASGISTPWRAASSRTAAVVFTPSATMFISVMMSSSVAALAELDTDVAVAALRAAARRDRDRPCPRARRTSADRRPSSTPRRASSARPRVINAALVLSPYPRPSAMPAPIASTFFERARDLAADDVGIRVDAQRRREEQLLHLVGDRRVGHRDHRRGGLARPRPRARGSGRSARRRTRHRDPRAPRRDLGHARERSLLDALRQAHDGNSRPDERAALRRAPRATRATARRARPRPRRCTPLRVKRSRGGVRATGCRAGTRGSRARRGSAPRARPTRPQHGGDVAGRDRGHGRAPRPRADDRDCRVTPVSGARSPVPGSRHHHASSPGPGRCG